MTSKGLVAVLVGAGVGVVAAIAAVGPWRQTPPSVERAALSPARAPSFDRFDAKPLEATHRATEADLPVTAATVTSTASAGPDASLAPPLPLAPEDEIPIATTAEFEAAAVACDGKDAGACRRAAAAAEMGTVVPQDRERAKTFRKVELTTIVRACEKRAVAACLTLADRYLRGDGVAQNERTATALIEHVKEICSLRHEDACRGVPSN